MTAEVEFGARPVPGPPVRSPAMRTYCATLARFTSAVQSTEQLLRNDDAGAREDADQREQTAAIRLRGVDRAGAAAVDGLDQCATVRTEYGLPAAESRLAPTGDHDVLGAAVRDPGVPAATQVDPHAIGLAPEPHPGPGFSGTADDRSEWDPAGRVTVAPRPAPAAVTAAEPGLDRLRRTGGADLGVALTTLGRRRDELRAAETEFTRWFQAYDERSRRVTHGAVGVAGLAGAAVMGVVGAAASAATALALLVVCTLAVVATGTGVAAIRRLPRVCRGAGLARRPSGPALARFGAQVGGVALLALAAVNIGAGAL
ncbi:hypothetical protein [Jiangella anatolica]|uniref:Uncharacterized protein n=1 Tax=Jiangella anatolica TaxID=2670374 RepID=A0A2W2B8X9_9ACTN|nr:hypothetical protein [Jiangella anatolica]PZF83695.1 hypothetical protein C1I92_11290 [Jiangella anatolica]